jgi:hypothetical protein
MRWCGGSPPPPTGARAATELQTALVTAQHRLEAIAGGAQAWVRLSGVADEPLADARLWRWQAPAGN